MQAASDEDQWPAYLGLEAPGPWTSMLEQAYSDPDWQVANEIAKPKVAINSNNSSVDCKKQQPEICNRK